MKCKNMYVNMKLILLLLLKHRLFDISVFSLYQCCETEARMISSIGHLISVIEQELAEKICNWYRQLVYEINEILSCQQIIKVN
jgi:hypothetical protein